MHDEALKVRYRFERGKIWHDGHLARFAKASSQVLQSMPWAISSSPLGTSAGLANGSLDLPGLQPEPNIRLRAIEYQGKALIERIYDRDGWLERIDYFDGISVSYGWNMRSWITSVKVGTEQPTRWTYRDDGLATSVVYPDGSHFLFEYTDDQRPLRRLYPDGWSITFHYDATKRLIETKTPEAVFSYPATANDGALWHVTAGVIRHEMSAKAGKVDIACSPNACDSSDKLQIISALGVWTYEQGQLRQMVLPDGERLLFQTTPTQVRMHSNGCETYSCDTSGKWTGTLQDDRSRLVIHHLPDSHLAILIGTAAVSLLTFNSSGRIIKCRCSDGRYLIIDRDRHEQIRQVSSDQGWLKLNYGQAGRISNISDSSGLQVNISYDRSNIIDRLAVTADQQNVGLAGLLMSRCLWQMSADRALTSGSQFCIV